MSTGSGSDLSHLRPVLRMLRSSSREPRHPRFSRPVLVDQPGLLIAWYEQGVREFSAHLWRADLQGAQLGWIDLQQANLIAANPRQTCLVGANLAGASLIGADLREADLRRSCLRYCSLWRADLRGADLRGADLERAGGWSALYSATTRWDEGIDPQELGLRFLEAEEA